MFLSVIIPAYNEEKRIATTLKSLADYFKDKEYNYEVIVIDDGSEDATMQAAEEFKSRLSSLKLIRHGKNFGKGEAVRTGILAAQGRYRLFMDADNSVAIDNFDKLFPYFQQGYNVAIGSIGIKGAEVAHTEKAYKRLFGKTGNLFIQTLLLPGIKDTQRGFKIFSAETAGEIFKRLTIKRWGFDFELLAIAKKLGYKIKEVPVRFANDPESKVKFSAYVKTLLEVVKVKFGLLTGRYK